MKPIYSDKIRIAPSGHARALHSLVLQYIKVCDELEKGWAGGGTPWMDLRGKRTGFHEKDDIFFEKNAWDSFFVQDKLQRGELFKIEHCNGRWDFVIIHHSTIPEDLERYHNVAKKYLKIKPHIVEQASLFVQSNFSNKSVVGVHIRGQDKFYDFGRPHVPLSYFEQLIEDKLLDRYDKVYISTDTVGVVDRFKEKYRDRVLFRDINRGIIHGHTHALHESNNNPVQTGTDVLVDSLVMSHCDCLIKQQSNVTSFSCIQNPNMEVHNFDLPFWRHYNAFCHSRDAEICRKYHYKSEYELDSTPEYVALYDRLVEQIHTNNKRTDPIPYTEENKAMFENFFYNGIL